MVRARPRHPCSIDAFFSLRPLKQQLQPELDASRTVGRNESAERRRADEVVRQAEVRMIEQIEELRAELNRDGFADRGVLDDREV